MKLFSHQITSINEYKQDHKKSTEAPEEFWALLAENFV
jgi:hypothetical protein